MRHTVLSTGRWPSLRSRRITVLRELRSCKFNVLILEGSVFWQQTLHQSSTCKQGLAAVQGAKNEPLLHHFPIETRQCLSPRITALFSTEDGSVLQCSAQQVLCLSLLCFPTCSTLPNPLCCWLNRFGGSGTVFDSGKISRSLQTQVVLLNLFLSLHSDI